MKTCNRCCMRPASREAKLRRVTWERLCDTCFDSGDPAIDRGSYVPPDGQSIEVAHG